MYFLKCKCSLNSGETWWCSGLWHRSLLQPGQGGSVSRPITSKAQPLSSSLIHSFMANCIFIYLAILLQWFPSRQKIVDIWPHPEMDNFWSECPKYINQIDFLVASLKSLQWVFLRFVIQRNTLASKKPVLLEFRRQLPSLLKEYKFWNSKNIQF